MWSIYIAALHTQIISIVDVVRHQGRVIWLTYEGEGPIDETVMLVGKGICYDTGGADIKAGGVMAGMHRDKCGAAAVAGFFQVCDWLLIDIMSVVSPQLSS